MTPRELLKKTTIRFREAGVPDPETDSAQLLSHLTGRAPLMLRLDSDTRLPDFVVDGFEELCAERESGVPLQHILGTARFYGRDFHTDARALIPRPETELLIELAVKHCRENHMICPSILDLCTGSGCIGITMQLMLPGASVTMTDISQDAADLARRNVLRYDAPVRLLTGDLFEPVSGMRFDLILSNPPYIPTGICETLQREVRDHEPRIALDGGEDGLFFYRRIANEAPGHLKHGGMLMLEIGYDQAQSVGELLENAGFTDILIWRDMNGLDRVVTGRAAEVDDVR
ncbi:MAG: peptide chain release factor N(5)-glutamine methyltransferase [Clostridia bacterium]|nr:peptide chain release factor N(5)-glutamine methyltransferase [Clostridia bacterium]